MARALQSQRRRTARASQVAAAARPTHRKSLPQHGPRIASRRRRTARASQATAATRLAHHIMMSPPPHDPRIASRRRRTARASQVTAAARPAHHKSTPPHGRTSQVAATARPALRKPPPLHGPRIASQRRRTARASQVNAAARPAHRKVTATARTAHRKSPQPHGQRIVSQRRRTASASRDTAATRSPNATRLDRLSWPALHPTHCRLARPPPARIDCFPRLDPVPLTRPASHPFTACLVLSPCPPRLTLPARLDQCPLALAPPPPGFNPVRGPRHSSRPASIAPPAARLPRNAPITHLGPTKSPPNGPPRSIPSRLSSLPIPSRLVHSSQPASHPFTVRLNLPLQARLAPPLTTALFALLARIGCMPRPDLLPSIASPGQPCTPPTAASLAPLLLASIAFPGSTRSPLRDPPRTHSLLASISPPARLD